MKAFNENEQWSCGESMKPHMEMFNIIIHHSRLHTEIVIDGQPFWFNDYMQFVFFVRGFKFAIQENQKKG